MSNFVLGFYFIIRDAEISIAYLTDNYRFGPRYYYDSEGSSRNDTSDKVTITGNLFINYPVDSPECSLGTKEVSWGAIKAINNLDKE